MKDNNNLKKPGDKGYDEINDSAFLNKHGKAFLTVKYIIIGVFIAYFAVSWLYVQPLIATGDSMLPTVKDGQFVYCMRREEPQKGDLVYVFAYPKRENERLYIPERILKRLMAVPGDKVKIMNGKLYVNDVQEDYDFPEMEEKGLILDEIVLKEDEYLVLGDNRNHSADSREFGLFSRSQIKGVIHLTNWFPPKFSI